MFAFNDRQRTAKQEKALDVIVSVTALQSGPHEYTIPLQKTQHQSYRDSMLLNDICYTLYTRGFALIRLPNGNAIDLSEYRGTMLALETDVYRQLLGIFLCTSNFAPSTLSQMNKHRAT